MTLTEALRVARDRLDREVYPSHSHHNGPYVKYNTLLAALNAIEDELAKRDAARVVDR